MYEVGVVHLMMRSHERTKTMNEKRSEIVAAESANIPDHSNCNAE